ncbi:MAG TPA: hypothetical protein VIN71_13400 [Pseudomonadales bacterium]
MKKSLSGLLLCLLVIPAIAETETALGNKLKAGIDASEEGLRKLDGKAREVAEKVDQDARTVFEAGKEVTGNTLQDIKRVSSELAEKQQAEAVQQQRRQEQEKETDSSWWKFWD